jgi:hypothetical protein
MVDLNLKGRIMYKRIEYVLQKLGQKIGKYYLRRHKLMVPFS